MGVDATILIENEVLCFPHGKSNLHGNSGVGGQQDSKLMICHAHWKDLDGNGCNSATVPQNLWGSLFLKNISVVLIMDDHDSLMTSWSMRRWAW